MRNSLLSRILVQAAMAVLVIASLLPMYNVLTASFKTVDEYNAQPLTLPQAPTLDNYQYAAFSGQLLTYTVNSLVYVPVALVLYLAVCILAGYAFGKMRFRFKQSVFLLVLFLSIFPQLLLATQVFKLVSLLHLTNTPFGAIVTWVAYFSPFGTYIMTTYFAEMPFELVEAARIDGAGPVRTLISVMVPMAQPMIATLAIIGFQSMWNELPFTLLILQEQGLRTLTVGIAMMRGEYGLRVPILSAALTLAMIVPIAVFLVFQKRITLGVTAGAVKG